MKLLVRFSIVVAFACCLAPSSQANVLLDDFFTLSNRTTQTLPTSSAWFANGNGSTLTNDVGHMTGSPPTSSCMWMTYFMPPGVPSALAIGDTLTVTMVFTPYGVSPNGNAGANFRIGFFNYSAGGTRVTGDGFSTTGGNGANVLGYAEFMNFGQTFGINNPLSIRKRTTTTDSNLMGTSGDFTNLGSGGGNLGDPGFTNGTPYTFVFSVTRNDVDSVTITNRFFGTNLDISTVATDSSGTVTNFDCFVMRPANSVGCATNLVIIEFKVEGPAGLSTAPSITTSPSDQTLTVSDFGMFSVAAAGGTPLRYQWYFNTASAPLPNQTNAILLLTNIQSSQAGQYFAIVTNFQGSATSAPANLTVNIPVHTGTGLVLDDTFQNISRGASASPVTSSNSLWAASADTTLSQPEPGSLLGAAQTNTSTLWVGNFVDPFAAAPIDLAVGTELKASLVFYPTNVAAQNTSSLRFGLFDFYDGGTVLVDDGNLATPTWNGSGGGANVRGYMLTANFGTTFGDATPLGLYVRTNLPSAGLMSSTGDFLSLGSGPPGMSNAPAFTDGTQYTLTLTVARVAATQTRIIGQFTGGQLTNVYFITNDSTFFTHRFSGLGIRPNRTTDSAAVINMTEFKVEVLPVPPPMLPFSITAQGFAAPGNFSLTWNSVPGKYYVIESTPTFGPAAWVTNALVTATASVTSWTNTSGLNASGFYRVLAPNQP